MPYALHSRLTFSGIYGSTASPFEAWSFRLNLGPITVGDVPTSALEAARDSWILNVSGGVGSAARLTEVKHARIGIDGRYTDEPDILPCDNPGGSPTNIIYPPQIAMCVSLITATRGASGRGRIYIPNPIFQVNGSGLLVETDAQGYATRTATFLGDINAIGNFGPVVVASTKGFNSVVTEVRAGRVLDTIRSRRRSMDEAYGAEVPVSQVAG